ncbi:MAG: hypothetical protein CSA11_05765 [Chloroflexi bacterium]|nr:MAG: hypothetical protein CSB13_08445 [Chloroflexota bacterium]PIE80964.1 MAG: hypothetical protein CSA11_05765 [Chloroflexota bacterium]
MVTTLIIVLALILAVFQAIRTKHLLPAALWLACTSALTACLLYTLGAHEVAVIELSVGAGLVTVLFVFGISIAGEDAMGKPALVPWTIAGAVALTAMGLVAWFTLPTSEPAAAVAEPAFSTMLWEQRGLDVLVQIGLIFAGVLGILGILAEKEPAAQAIPEPVPAPPQSGLPEPQPTIIEGAVDGALPEITA